MVTCKTDNADPFFCQLTAQLDKELHARYSTLQSTYDKHNKIDPIATALLGYEDDKAVACGCFKKIDTQCVEMKRMFVVPKFRRQGFSSQLLRELEAWVQALGFSEARLETGKAQPEAIALYTKMGYRIIPNYPPYVGMENSVCMHKLLRS